MFDVIIIGGGPAGLTAALYTARAGKSALVIEKNTYGGQITWSDAVENFPALETLSGLELADKLVAQLSDYDVEFELDEVSEVYYINDDEGKRKFIVKTVFGEEFHSRAVIAATGARPRLLGIDREDEFIGSGISFCAVCDGGFFKEKPVAVAGGGNSALQEALYLSDICSKVYLVHRRDQFRGEESLVEQLKTRDNVEFVLSAKVKEVAGERILDSLTVESTVDGSLRKLEVAGLFIAIGHEPDTELIKDYTAVDSEGYALCDETCNTETKGIFVAGDCRKKSVRQLTTAMADGSTSAIEACHYIDSL